MVCSFTQGTGGGAARPVREAPEAKQARKFALLQARRDKQQAIRSKQIPDVYWMQSQRNLLRSDVVLSRKEKSETPLKYLIQVAGRMELRLPMGESI